MNYSAYPGYKDSRIEWLGEIPEEWSHSKLGFESIVKARLGWKGLKADEYIASGYIFLATPNIKGNDIDFDNVNYITKERYEESPEIMLQLGDILVTKDGSTVGTTNVVRYLPEAATVNSSIAVVRPFQTLDSIYLYYFLSSSYVQNVIQRMKGGMGVPHLFQEDLRKFSIILPSLSEQTAIANFLDHETAKIDTLIAKQQRLIELLQEKRQALISHAVTKGLNPDAPMKDSGVEWIGEVPEHWEISRFGRELQRIETGWTPDSEQRLAEDHEWAVLKVGCIRNGNFYEEEHKALLPDVIPLPELEVRAGDLLMSRANTTELVGSVGLIRKTRPNLTLSDKTFRLILKDSILPEYANALLQAKIARIQIELAATGASPSMKNISQESIRAMKLPVPPVNEQKETLSLLNNELAKIAQLIQKTQQAIALSNERRSSLISAAVTGKIDLRGHV